MEVPIEAKIAAITKLNAAELQKAYKELFNEEDEFSHNRRYLIRQIAHRLQELEYGGILERSRKRIKELMINTISLIIKSSGRIQRLLIRTIHTENLETNGCLFPETRLLRCIKAAQEARG